jgi:Family of unknown function (DUF5684)
MSTLAFLLMQSDSGSNAAGNAAAAGIMGALGLVWVAVLVLMLAGLWKIFVKAGEPGWAAIIPIYNLVVMLKIVGRPTWWLVLFLIPFVNLIMMFVIAFDTAKVFGKGAGFALGMIFLSPIFYPILGFGSAKYQGAPAVA